ncbi:hypothetical protein ABFS83_09G072900 [Erythranthe nasuta]|uniref:Uncharacterized protein n=1 Tax=Erythranthe guttata TaxID=4155 RepID=A0A022Q5J7_ERYGU|nr:PREDICTED: uncharacterized protein LOC105975897 [Erythranthe guttata]EYU21810.1 hypothetical protein MIMGU_mgv1a015525mg [Erythranthe guttata]|eukprot:XP_012856593.1 PREDICTED: uncharacterized protein LOC105975897 [Erythranthe guttata]
MNKILDFGRKAMFYVRVLSGYEERRIRSYRLQLQQRLQQAQEKKAALKQVPEQIIISEVRRMVEEMQSLNKKLEDTEAAIEEYFKPVDKEAEFIMKMQLEGEEKTMKDMMKAMQTQALLEKAEAEKTAALQNSKTDHQIEESSSSSAPDKRAQVG